MFLQGTAALVALTLAFISTEGMQWHRPTFEFLFFWLVLVAGSTLALLAPDSPLQYVVTINRHPGSMLVVFGLAVPLYAAMVVQNVLESGLVSFQQHRGGLQFQERLLAAQELSRRRKSEPRRRSRRSSSSALDSSVVSEQDLVARSKQQYVSRTLDRLVFSSQLRHFAAWMRGQIDERQEALRKVMQEASTDELNNIISTINVPKLLRHGNNGRKIDNLLAYLMEKRHADLSTIARASVLHGLMRSQTLQFFRQEMEWSVQIFCGAKGAELTLLKNMLDSSGDFNNLYKLVYNDIRDPELRSKILRHIKEEGRVVREENEARGPLPLKLLSDVDDTLSCSGGSFPAGADARYPRHAVYPGVLALYEEIDLASRASAMGEPEGEDGVGASSGKIVNVTVQVPWQQGGGTHDLSCGTNDTIRALHDTVQARYNIMPKEQRLTLTMSKQQPSMGDNVNLWKDGNLVFVSARPHVFKDVAENGSYRRFHKLVNQGRMHATPTMLSGSLSSGTLALVFRMVERMQLLAIDFWEMGLASASALSESAKQRVKRHRKRRRGSLAPEEGAEDDDDEGGLDGVNGNELNRVYSSMGARLATNRNWEAVGRTKVDSMQKYAELYPEYELVFFGDNGQGDLLAAELAAAKGKSTQGKLRMSFIHKVQPLEGSALLSYFAPEEREDKWDELNIVFFETYVGAATLALENDLITPHGLHRVGLAVHDELLELFIKYPHRNWTEVHSQTKRDIRRANKLLRVSNVDLQIPVPLLPHGFVEAALS